jgi:hypothetical protein
LGHPIFRYLDRFAPPLVFEIFPARYLYRLQQPQEGYQGYHHGDHDLGKGKTSVIGE